MASKRHKKVGELLNTIPLTMHMQKREEVSVKDLVPSFPGRRMKIDWYVKELKLVIEVHGRQHYEPVAFGNRGDSKLQYGKQVRHDIDKQNALVNEGYAYLEIPYWVKLTEVWLIQAITELDYKSCPEPNARTTTEPVRQPRVSNRIRSRGFEHPPKHNLLSGNRLKSRGFPKKDQPQDSWRQELEKIKDEHDHNE